MRGFGSVEAAAGALDRPLAEQRPHGADSGPEADLPDLTARLGGDEVRELGAAPLEADRADVGDVVADDGERRAGVGQAAASRRECAEECHRRVLLLLVGSGFGRVRGLRVHPHLVHLIERHAQARHQVLPHF